MHPAPHLTRLPAATHTQVRDHAHTPITLPQHQSMPLPTTAPPHPHMKILRAPARSAPRRATPPPAAPRPPARPARRSGGRMDARGGQVGGGWVRVAAEVRVVAPHEGGWRQGRATATAPRTERMRKNVSRRRRRRPNLPPRMPRPRGKLGRKGQDAARTRAAKGQDHAAAIVDVRARERPQHQPSHEASASARRVTRRQTAAFGGTRGDSKEDENALPCRACGFCS